MADIDRYAKKFYCTECGLRWDVHSDSKPPARPKCCPGCKRRTGFRQVGKSHIVVSGIEVDFDSFKVEE